MPRIKPCNDPDPYSQFKTEEQKKAKRACSKLNYAVKKGIVVKPDWCERCGIQCTPQAHHKDYSKPLLVIWLCRECHYGWIHGRTTIGHTVAPTERRHKNAETLRLALDDEWENY